MKDLHQNTNQIPDFLQKGAKTRIGSYHFTIENIVEFARQYDPQVFHMDEAAAKQTLFGGLCASGWHTVSVWMKLQRKSVGQITSRLQNAGQCWPEFGPSPGMEEIKWHKPVFAGDTVTYTNAITDIRKSKSRPQWWLMSSSVHAENQKGETVMTFKSTVFLKLYSPVNSETVN